MQGGTLWLIPSTLGGNQVDDVIPYAVLSRIRALRFFLAEEPKSARAFLKLAGHPGPMSDLRIERLTNDTSADELSGMIAILRNGIDAAVISEAGCPAVADPGASLIRLAHEAGVRVVPLTGPSSITLALMASGLETQRFAFHGYLPVKEPARGQAIKRFEDRSRNERETQIFIETPYRNRALLSAMLNTCRADTLLCIGCDLTLPSESIFTRSVRLWRNEAAILDNRPCVFLLLSEREITGNKHA
jgi:16S rRNA (cytidine1402-2'-O)-methyltransferase